MAAGQELGVGYVSLTVEAEGIESELRQKVGGPAEQEAERAGRAGGERFSGAFSGAFKGLAVAAGGALAAVGIGQFVSGAISSASDLNETMSKSATVFGENAEWVSRWGDNAASALGQSKQQAIAAASQFGNMFKQMGVGSDTAMETSVVMTELASDFASFHNADITEVLDAQQAAFRGEYDSIQRFLPMLNAAAVENKALAMTGKESAEALTDQEKAMATAQLMMEGGGDAIGDFARTSDGAANQQRILAARFADVKAEIGQGLLPVVTAVGGFILDTLIPAFKTVGSVVVEAFQFIAGSFSAGENVGAGGGWVEAAGAIGVAARRVVDFFVRNWPTIRDVVVTAFQAVWDVVKRVVAVFTEIVTFIATNQPVLIGLGVAIGVGLVAAFAAWAISAGAAALATLVAMAPLIAIGAVIAAVVAGVIWAYQNFGWFREAVQAVASFLSDTLWPILQTVGRVIGEVIVGYIQIAIGVIRTYIGFWVAVGQAVADAVRWVIDRAGDMVNFITGIPGRVSSFLGSVFRPLTDAASSAVGWVADQVGAIVGWITGIPGRVGNVFSGMFDGISGAMRSAVNAVAGLWNRTVGRLSFQIPGWVPGIGGNGWDVPDIPYLAKGGLAMSATAAVVGELSTRANPEVIAPLDRLRAMLEPAQAAGPGEVNVYAQTNASPALIARASYFQWKHGGK